MHSSIHIKLDNDEAVNLKKNMLLLERDLLESVKFIRNYEALRKKEFLLKSKVKRDLVMVHALINSAELDLPKEEHEFEHEAKEYTHEAEGKELSKIKKSRIIEHKKSDIERQIDEIREKLSRLGVQE